MSKKIILGGEFANMPYLMQTLMDLCVRENWVCNIAMDVCSWQSTTYCVTFEHDNDAVLFRLKYSDEELVIALGQLREHVYHGTV